MFRAFIGNTANRLIWARRLALIFLMVYIAIILTASIIIITNANHECLGDGCPICKLIHNAAMLLQGICKVTASLFAAYIAVSIISSIITPAGLICNHSTNLITAKVRLNI